MPSSGGAVFVGDQVDPLQTWRRGDPQPLQAVLQAYQVRPKHDSSPRTAVGKSVCPVRSYVALQEKMVDQFLRKAY